jgi:hypothetical protein
MTSKKSISFFFVFLCVAVTILTACKKDNTPPPVVPLTRTQVLVKYTWEPSEIWRNIAGVNTHYIRGGVNTTGTNYDVMRLSFKSDSTGTYVDETGLSHTATWQFTSADQHNMSFTIGPPSAQTFIWNLVEISDSTFTSTSPGGSASLLSARFVPAGLSGN